MKDLINDKLHPIYQLVSHPFYQITGISQSILCNMSFSRQKDLSRDHGFTCMYTQSDDYWPAPPGVPSVQCQSGLCNWFLCIYVLCGFVTYFLILLQYNIRLPSLNCDMCAPKFVPRVNLRRHNISTQTVMNIMTFFL